MLLVILIERQKRRTDPNYHTSWGTVVVMIVAITILLLLADRNPAWLFLVPAIPIVLLVGALLPLAVKHLLHRARHHAVFQARRQTQDGRIDNAISILREQVRNHPASIIGYTELATALGQMKKWDEALAVLEQAEALNAQHPVVLNNKGLFLWMLGRTPEARSYLERAVQHMPNDLAVLCNYGSVLAEMGQCDEATRLLQQAESLAAVFPAAAKQEDRQMLEAFRRKLAQ